MFRRVGLLLAALMVLFSVTACSNVPSGDPQEVVNTYYQSLVDANYANAYGLLSAYNKKNQTIDDYIACEALVDETCKTIDFSISTVNDVKDYSYDSVEFGDVKEVTITGKYEDYMEDNKEKSYTSVKYVIAEEGEWRILEARDPKELYAFRLDEVGWMYLYGKGKDLDINQSIGYFLQAIQVDPEYTRSYYDISCAYIDNENYDKALEYVMVGIAKTDEKDATDYYNLKGICYRNKGDYQNAAAAYQKALEIDSTNAYAEDNLRRIQDFI